MIRPVAAPAGLLAACRLMCCNASRRVSCASILHVPRARPAPPTAAEYSGRPANKRPCARLSPGTGAGRPIRRRACCPLIRSERARRDTRRDEKFSLAAHLFSSCTRRCVRPAGAGRSPQPDWRPHWSTTCGASQPARTPRQERELYDVAANRMGPIGSPGPGRQ
jgi:hypothetical protein